ncbi:MAG TPA: class I SAM-dependent methyltransferase [Candidatus Rifleibacterium sp.]|nr:class I SAM-dependent methyltransferase [Candidatus Rifleibacterium sp.]
MDCICCHSQTISLPVKDEFHGLSLQKCLRCHHIQLARIPTQSALNEYYEKSYSTTRKSFLNEIYLRVMKERARAQKRYIINNVEIDSRHQIHDIGCGYGFLLEALNLDCQISGYDYDPEAISFCQKKGLKAYSSHDFDPAKTLGNHFMAILSHSLEHMPNPSESLQNLLNKYQYVFIEIPSYGSAHPSALQTNEGHIHFFCLRSLRAMLEQLPCRIVHIGSYGPKKTFFLHPLFSFLRRIWHYVDSEYYFNQYEKQQRADNGIWLRCIIQSNQSSIERELMQPSQPTDID